MPDVQSNRPVESLDTVGSIANTTDTADDGARALVVGTEKVPR